MSRHPGRSATREHIAHLAARIMAEDGIEDHALAKRKAARQAGAPDTRQLPDNDEIDAALQTYRDLFQRGHAGEIQALRELAAEIMRGLSRFNPYLTGSVLTGTAGRFADIQLQLFVDSPKEVEIELLNRGVKFETATARLFAGDMPIDAPVMSFEHDAVTVRLTLLTPRELRSRIRASAGGKPVDRADMTEVESLLAQE
jgi:hypothetical protein